MAKSFPNTGVTTGLSSDRSSMSGMFAGQEFFETDTKKLYLYNGTNWIEVKDCSLTYKPSFSVTGNGGNVTVAAGAAFPFNTVNFDTGSNYNYSTYRFVAPVAGLYLFGVSYYAQQATSVCFTKNGSQWYSTADLNPLITAGAAGYTPGASLLITLALNDYVDVRSRNLQSNYVYIPHSTFWGFLIN